MKLSLKALLIVSTISLLIVFSSSFSLFQLTQERSQKQIEMVEQTVRNSLQYNPTLHPEQKEQVAQQVVEKLTAGAKRNVFGMITLLALSIFVSAIITYVLFLRLTSKLGKIVAAAHSIESAKYSYTLKIDSNDELKELAEAVNSMSHTIQEREAELVCKNEDLRIEVKKRKQDEGLLRDRENYLKTLFHTVKSGIVLIDPESYTIVDANESMAKMIECSMDELIGNNCCGFFCPATQKSCPITVIGENLNNTEKKLVTKDGTSIPVLKTATFVELNGKKHILETVLDISELKSPIVNN